MKKYFILSLVSILIVSMVGCGKNTSTQQDSISQEQTTDSSNSSSDSSDSSEIKATDQIINADKYDNLIQVNNKVIELPATVQDFLDAGATLESVSPDKITPDAILSSGESKDIYLVIGDVTKIRVKPRNNSTEKQITLKEADITKIESTTFSYDISSKINSEKLDSNSVNNNVFFSKGLKLGITQDELKQIWGEPDKIKEQVGYLDYYYAQNYFNITDPIYKTEEYTSATQNMYVVSVYKNTGLVSQINYEFSMVKGDDDAQKLLTLTKSSQDSKLQYQVPLCFSNRVYDYEENQYLYEIDGTQYVINMDSQPVPAMISSYSFDGSEKAMERLMEDDYVKGYEKFEMLKTDGNQKWAYAYKTKYKNENQTLAAGMYYSGKKVWCITFKINPYKAGDTVSDAALNKFYDMVKQYTLAMTES